MDLKEKGRKKIFVLDTNVGLYDSSCLYSFDEHDIVILIEVIEELDGFRKGNSDDINYHAREFTRSLDEISDEAIFNGGVSIGKDFGKIITIKLGTKFDEKIKSNFPIDKADHKILNTAYVLAQQKKDCDVILVTKDTRLKAKSIGLFTEDYKTNKVENLDDLEQGSIRLDHISQKTLDLMFQKPFFSQNYDEFIRENDLGSNVFFPNQFLILKNLNSSVLAKVDSTCTEIKAIKKISCCAGIKPKNAEQYFAIDALLNDDIPLVTLSGKAGTGKTMLALAAAIEKRKSYRQIFIARPIVPLSNKDSGFLPGDIKDKIDPYMQPIYDNLSIIDDQGTKNSKKLLENEKIVVTPLSYIRGRSIVRVFFIVDEAQNLTPHEIKTIITRAGENTKIVFTGDIHQIDHPYLDSASNGFSYLISKMKGQGIYAHVDLKKGERSNLSEIASKIL